METLVALNMAVVLMMEVTAAAMAPAPLAACRAAGCSLGVAPSRDTATHTGS